MMNNSIPGLLVKVEDVVLTNGLHRMKFQQSGWVPDVDALLAQHGPKDGQHTACASWMDERGIGHAYIAWKEWKSDPLPGIS
jgi:hypothetical protein